GGVYIVRYNDETDSLDTIVDVPEAVGEPTDNGRATQCKIHYSFAASPNDATLYAATHLSAPGLGRRRYSAWGDWKDEKSAFPYSMLLAYDTARDEVAWTSRFIPREGCRCLALSAERGLLYAVSYPRDHFWVYDIAKREIRDLGRMGSINSQAVFTDRRGRGYCTNGDGQFVRYSPDEDRLEEIPIFVPHDPVLNGWHCVFYDVVGSPEGDCVYGVPWTANPHLFRYWPEEGPYGRIEDLGAVHQDRDKTMSISYFLDHCGGLVFGADGLLYFATTRWAPGMEQMSSRDFDDYQTEVIVVQMDPRTLARKDFARLEKPGAYGHYVARAARDRFGNLLFGHVNRPIPVGISRLPMDAEGDDLHRPLRTWG
ncbi:MAG TPA: hypothetical protein VM389_05295, partial [Phycisphaerae bacterium]|nr:hypothetical protein [Phycisphaerae bacterium]